MEPRPLAPRVVPPVSWEPGVSSVVDDDGAPSPVFEWTAKIALAVAVVVLIALTIRRVS